MDRNLCKKVIENKLSLVPIIFTQKQIEILEKYTNKQFLTNSERVRLYSVIKKKVFALQTLQSNFYFYGQKEKMLRVKEAKGILKNIGKHKAFISGSFLFKEEYDDIDIFVLGKKRHQYFLENQGENKKDKYHFTCITEKDLSKPMFASAARFSISNFEMLDFTVDKKKDNIDEYIMAYQMVVSEFLGKKDMLSELRRIVLLHELQINGRLLNSCELYETCKTIKNSANKIEKINRIISEICKTLFSNRYISDYLKSFSKNLGELIRTHKTHDNLVIVKKTMDEIVNEARRAKT